MSRMSGIGFRVSEDEPKDAEYEKPACEHPTASVKSLANVSFATGQVLTYYNDQFDLRVGDLVFVSGKLAGQPGFVTAVTTKFRINLSGYEKILSCADMTVHGTYRKIKDKMVSFGDEAVSPEQFRSWVLAPLTGDEGAQIIVGDGYEVPLEDFEADDEVSGAVLSRAVDYLSEGRVKYIGMRNGEVTAFVEGTHFYEVNFRLEDGMVTGLYCDCPFPGFCKHAAAVLVTVRTLMRDFGNDSIRQFTAIDEDFFWSAVARTTKEITL